MEQPGSRKRKRLSKNKKKSWKFTDVKDVEEYLDDKRLQERTGWVDFGHISIICMSDNRNLGHVLWNEP